MKAAYHRALLLHHPDKTRGRFSLGATTAPTIDNARTSSERHSSPSVDEIQQAYVTLSDPILRAAYDARLASDPFKREKGSQRPAEIVSLEEFSPTTEGSDTLSYPCRCGEMYCITEEQLDADIHLIGCRGCSEAVWVGYEAIEES